MQLFGSGDSARARQTFPWIAWGFYDPKRDQTVLCNAGVPVWEWGFVRVSEKSLTILEPLKICLFNG